MAVNIDPLEQSFIEFKHILVKRKINESKDCISEKIWNFYLNNSQVYKVLNQKMKLKNELKEILSNYFVENGSKYVEFFTSGSTANGFATNDSDIDLCFIVKDNYDIELVKSQKIKILHKIESILCESGFELNDCQLIDAKVPILRYIDSKSGIQVEINVNNDIGIRNTRLLYCYSKLDWRAVPICLSLKKWAKVNGIIDSFSGALSSYCFELMVIFYLQRLRPPVLPSLQFLNPELFDRTVDIKNFTEMPDLNELSPFKSRNNQTLEQLFSGFFKYYLFQFDFTKHFASIRLGRSFDKQSVQITDYQFKWDLICIEEPFSGLNAAQTVYDMNGYNKVVDGFKDMHNKCLKYYCDCSQ